MIKIGIVLGSVREGRLGNQVADWFLEEANKRNDENVEYELVDLADYRLPLLGISPSGEEAETIKNWSEKMASFDGYVYVTAEYNHAIPGAFKNALDYLKPELADKAVGFAGYGGLGAARSIEMHRSAAALQGLAGVSRDVNLNLAVDFENFQTFKPAPFHNDEVKGLLDQLISWSKALKTVRLETVNN